MVDVKNLSDNIRKFRNEKGMTQNDISRCMGVSQDAISLWERGKSFPSVKQLIELAEIFSTDIYSLLDDG